MDLSTQQACVDAGIETFAKAEVKAQAAIDAALKLPAIFDAANNLLMPEMGNLKTGLMKAQAQKAAGQIAAGLATLFALHRTATDIAIAAELDPPQAESGPGR